MTQRHKPDYQTQPGLPAGKPNKIRQTESPGGGSVPLSGIGRTVTNGPPRALGPRGRAGVGKGSVLGTHTPPDLFHPPRPDQPYFEYPPAEGWPVVRSE